MRRKKGKKARAIIELLQKRELLGEGGLTARDIHKELVDGTQISATHAALERLVEDGEVEKTGSTDVESGHSAAVFALKKGTALQPNLFENNIAPALEEVFGEESRIPRNFTDVYEGNEEQERLDTLQRIAKYNSRVETYESKRESLRQAARKLAEVDPRVLVRDFFWDLIKTFESGKRELESGLPAEKAKDLRSKLIEVAEVFEDAAQTIGLPKHIAQLKAPLDRSGRFKVGTDLSESEMYEELETYIDTVIFGQFVLNTVNDNDVKEAAERISTVTSSDGSTHPIALRALRRMQSEYEEASLLLFNNAAGVYTHIRKANGKFTREFHKNAKYRHLPLSYQDIQKGIPEGILMAPYLFRGLSESQYGHMLRFVPDNVQLLLDLNILSHKEDIKDKIGARPIPNVHIRDGMGVPYERGFPHYIENSDYGRQARKGINRYYEIVRQIVGARAMNETLILTGAVKEARLRFFAYLIDWFISRGSGLICPELEGEPIDVEWEEEVVSPNTLTDNKAMANLMAAAREVFQNQKFTSFRVRREFAVIADPSRPQQLDEHERYRPVHDWQALLNKRLNNKVEYEKSEGNPDYEEFAHMLDIQPFVKLCEQADITLFYTSDTGGSPAYTLPRYEFINNLKAMKQDEREREVERCVNTIIAGIEVSGGVELEERSFMRDPANLLRIVEPVIMLEAHNAVKITGQELANTITSAIYANVQELRLKLDLRSRIDLQPISFEQYRRIDRDFYKALAYYSKKEKDPAVIQRLQALGILDIDDLD